MLEGTSFADRSIIRSEELFSAPLGFFFLSFSQKSLGKDGVNLEGRWIERSLVEGHFLAF